MRGRQHWAVAIASAALVAALVPSALWGLVAATAIVTVAAIAAPRGAGHRLAPLALVTIGITAVVWLRERGAPI